jgi:hypothetical protein
VWLITLYHCGYHDGIVWLIMQDMVTLIHGWVISIMVGWYVWLGKWSLCVFQGMNDNTVLRHNVIPLF